MTAHTDHCHTHWYAGVHAAADAGISPDVHHCNRWRADHPGDHLCCCGTTRPRDKATNDRHQAVASSPQPPAAHLEGHTVTRWAMPDPPPADVTQVWTVQGIRADRCSAHDDCWLLEPGTALSHQRWPLLLTFGSPLSDTPPEETS